MHTYLCENNLLTIRIFVTNLADGSEYANYSIFWIVWAGEKAVLTFIIILLCKFVIVN